MIVEALAHLTTRAAPGARRAGLVYGQAALLGRWLRHRKAWTPHLANCRRVIAAAAARTARRDCVVVLGSGALLDIPLTELAGLFARVVLVDAAHPLHARVLARRLGGVEVRAESLVDLEGPVPRYRPWRPHAPVPDLVVASMVVSQLPLVRDRDDAGAPSWRSDLVAAAVAEIWNGPGAACVITETRRVHRARDGRVVAQADPLFGVAPPPADETWRWTMAPAGEIGPEAVELDVAASWRPV
ncbi:MAG: hypothetical protein JNK67_18805 [Alphaproteobacteria bacterium]|nr:hypothetical protein [Alphaproteobacteria bacterium]